MYFSLAILKRFSEESLPVAYTILAKNPSSFVMHSSSRLSARRLNGWSYSTPVPLAITSILSASITVASLWAMIRTVAEWLSMNYSRILDWMKLSVCKSTFAVASSRTNILVLRSIALAKQISCFCPTENSEVLSVTVVKRPYLRF